MEFAPFLDQWLREARWSQGQLARVAQISQGLVNKWVHPDARRRSIPSPRNLAKLAPVLAVPYEDLMRMCGYLPGEPRAQVDVRRQAVRDQLDRWLGAVGPENEEYFWQHLKAQGDSTVDLIRRVGTAVNAETEGAVNAAVSERAKRGRPGKTGPNGPLTERKYPAHRALTVGPNRSAQRHAA